MGKEKNISFLDSLNDIGVIAGQLGLDPFPTHYEVVPSNIMYEMAAYGLPGIFPHWTHGKTYHIMKTRYDYGLNKIYEMVINADPSVAFLLENNGELQNKVIAAHVLGHSDFFKNNVYFKNTNRQITDITHLHAERIRNYEYQYGWREVEQFLDSVLTISSHVDNSSPNKISNPQDYKKWAITEHEKRTKKPESPSSQYDDILLLGKAKEKETKTLKTPIPLDKEPDLLWFISTHSPLPLKDWQQDIINIVRELNLYFYPQKETKIMNEGWAALFHQKIIREMGEKGLITDDEFIQYSVMNATVLTPSRTPLNPYLVGVKIWEDIEKKFKGNIKDKDKKPKNWFGEEIDTKVYQGSISYDPFWVRETHRDISFIAEYLTDELVDELDLYTYEKVEDKWVITEKDPKKVRQNFVNSLQNYGQPVINIDVGGGDYNGNQELYLKHDWEGQKLDLERAKKTLTHIYNLWGRTVHLETVLGDDQLILSVNKGDSFSRSLVPLNRLKK